MSNSNLYGSIDRRRKLAVRTFRVQDALDKIYKEHGYTHTTGDPEAETAAYIEGVAINKAMRNLEPGDRRRIEGYRANLIEALKGTQFGDRAALQVLSHLGIFLAKCGE